MRSRSDSTVSLSTMKNSGNDKNSTFTNWDVCVERPGRDGWASNEAIRKADDYSANESIVHFLPTPIEEMNRYSTRSLRSKEDIISCKEVLPFQSTCFQSITPSGPGPPPGFGPGTGPGLGIEQLFNYNNQNTFELNEGISCNWNGPTIDFKDKTKSSILTERNLPKVHQLTTLTPSLPSYRIKSNQNNTPFKSNQALKKRKINEIKIVYPYFGNSIPHAPKICAMRCLEYLNGSDFYSVSVVNHLWSKTATDNALWE